MPISQTPLVLVADDEPSMLELVARHLKTMEDPKLEVIEASDGEAAWRMAREHLPDLVVLDVMMPGMSGWEVCRKIREDIALAHTGVVMLTGIGENLNMMTSPLYGADAYIDKPFEFDELDEKVKTALESRASQREGISRPVMNGVGGAAKAAKGGKAKAEKAPPAGKTGAKVAKAVARVATAAAKVAKATAAKAKAKHAASTAKAAPKKNAAKSAPKKAAKPAKSAPHKAKSKPAKAAPKKIAKKAPKKVVKKGPKKR